MSRYTDIDLLLNNYQTICGGVACMDCPFNDEGCRLEKMLLESQTADVIPVVRCKDCRWWFHEGDSQFGYCNACKQISIYKKYKADWFCADGEPTMGQVKGVTE